jgi:hypothetical protein
MAPASSAAARRSAARTQPTTTKGTRRAPLRVVPTTRPSRRPRRLMAYLPVGLILASLLAVVIGHAVLANGQIRLAGIEQKLSAEQGVHRQQELVVSELETPSRIVGAATGQLHMVHPSQVIQLPYVALTTPIATPRVTPAPAPPASTETQSASQ